MEITIGMSHVLLFSMLRYSWALPTLKNSCEKTLVNDRLLVNWTDISC